MLCSPFLSFFKTHLLPPSWFLVSSSGISTAIAVLSDTENVFRHSLPIWLIFPLLIPPGPCHFVSVWLCFFHETAFYILVLVLQIPLCPCAGCIGILL